MPSEPMEPTDQVNLKKITVDHDQHTSQFSNFNDGSLQSSQIVAVKGSGRNEAHTKSIITGKVQTRDSEDK